jgi:heme/copper-type cytochrome/quinol oxidase subunit 4
MLVFVLIVLCICSIIAILTMFQSIDEGEQDTFFAACIITVMLIISIVFTSINL